jgi:hypothetical protein
MPGSPRSSPPGRRGTEANARPPSAHRRRAPRAAAPRPASRTAGAGRGTARTDDRLRPPSLKPAVGPRSEARPTGHTVARDEPGPQPANGAGHVQRTERSAAGASNERGTRTHARLRRDASATGTTNVRLATCGTRVAILDSTLQTPPRPLMIRFIRDRPVGLSRASRPRCRLRRPWRCVGPWGRRC